MIPSTASDRRVLIAGAGAQLAGALKTDFAGCELRALAHADLDVTDLVAVRRAVEDFRPTVIINCAADNRVDQAEADPQSALAVNTFGVRTLARAAADAGASLVHYSSDFVFDGTGSRPYTEDDPPNPQSVYATSKLLGEWFAMETAGAYVLRVASLFGGSKAKSSVDRIVEALVEGREARVFSDRTASPSYVFDVAAATRAVLDRATPGLYHVVGSGFCTWYELALEAARLLDRERDARLIPVRAADMHLAAARPLYAALSNAKLSKVMVMPTWKDALARYVRARDSSHLSP